MFPDLDVKNFIRKPVSLNELVTRIMERTAVTAETKSRKLP